MHSQIRLLILQGEARLCRMEDQERLQQIAPTKKENATNRGHSGSHVV